MNRRSVLQLLSTIGLAGAAAPARVLGQPTDAPLLLRPQQFGAKADGAVLDSPAINAAIDRAFAQGGGVVYLSPGTYLSGTVVLKSNVTFYLEAGATLLGSKDVAQYTPQPGPAATGDANQRHLIFARDAENITLCGRGTVDGQGPSFWVPSGRRSHSEEDQWADVASLYLNPKPRVSPMLEFVSCRDLRVEGLRIENASGWTLRTVSCVGVVVDGISIKNPVVGPNTDGLDITNSSDVRIANCSIDTGDDAICLKSENPYSDTVPAMRNVVVTNCTLTSCCNGFKFGTRTHSGYENITFSNSTIHNTAESRVGARVIAGIALEMVDGGWVDGVVITGIRMQRTRTPIFLRLGARTPPPAGRQTYLRGVLISDVHATEAVLTNSITGLPGLPVEDVTLSNVHVESQEPGKLEWAQRQIPEVPRDYPEARMFGRLPAYGMYVRHAKGIRMRGVVFSASASEQRPAIVCDDVEGIEVAALSVPTHGAQSAVLSLRQSTDAWVHDGQAPTNVPGMVEVSGEQSANILVSGCDLRKAAQPVTFTGGATPASVTLANNISRT